MLDIAEIMYETPGWDGCEDVAYVPDPWKPQGPSVQSEPSLYGPFGSLISELTPTPDMTLWSSNPFVNILKPFGAFLEPEGYKIIQAMQRPVTASYARHMPLTRGLAQTIYDALPEVSAWGRQVQGSKSAWQTITAGKVISGTRKGKVCMYPQKAMSPWDILKMLADPAVLAIANKDVSGDRYSKVHHVRIDIDMDRTFDYDGQDHLPSLCGEIALIHQVFSAFDLAPQVFRTGNRGIQAVATTPYLDRSVAWVLTECVRTVLRDCRGQREWQAKDFQTSLEGLMRIPFGRHWYGGSLALFLGPDGRILPVEDQVTAFVESFYLTPDGYSTVWADEMRPRLGVAHEVPNITLAEIIAEFPRNTLVRQFLAACDKFDVKGWEKNSGGELVSHAKGESNNIKDRTLGNVTFELVSHTKGEDTNIDDNVSSSAKTSLTFATSPVKLKRIGWTILSAGFEPGQSFHYYVNEMNGVKGKNAIGWALVVHDGDRKAAKEWLDIQAEEIEGSTEDVAQRKAMIAWAVERNDTYERFQSRRSTRSHREMDVDIRPENTAVAERIADCLPELRKKSACRTKVFTPAALVVIGHILELMIAAARRSSDGLVQVSERTLASEIFARWPKCSPNQKDVARQMIWVTKGRPECLIEVLEVVERPKKVTDATVFRLCEGVR